MSRIRTNLITNRMANGAPTVSHGLVISGITTVTTLDLNGDLDVDGHLNADNVSIAGVVTATSFVGDGSGLTGAGPTLTNGADNRVITASSASAIQGEANMTFDGSTLTLTPGSSAGDVTSLVLGRTSSAPAAQTTAVVTGGIPISGVPGIFFGSTNTNLPAIGFQTPNSSNGHIVFNPKGSEKVRITAVGNLKLPDDAKIELGGGQTGTGDLQIYHDPENSFIKNNTGTLNIQSDTVRLTDVALAHIYLKGTASATELYHDNNVRLTTTSTGVTMNGTGAIILPIGTTGERPSGSNGMIRFNSTLSQTEEYRDSGWHGLSNKSVVSGGTVTTSGGYTIHTFTSSGTLTVSNGAKSGVDYLLVGGGGGGGGKGSVGNNGDTDSSNNFVDNNSGGNGGNGANNSYSGSNVSYAGGGGGGSRDDGPYGAGVHGGGNGGRNNSNVAQNGTANLGGGGGGGARLHGAAGYTYNGAAGGSGIVIIRYLT